MANVHIYEMLGLRASSLSAVTKVAAGQNNSSNYLTPNILYMMLATGVYITAFSINLIVILSAFNLAFNPIGNVKLF